MHSCQSNSSVAKQNAKDIKILVVDDEASIGRTLEGIFSDEGYSTIVVRDGESALEVLTREAVDAVLLDVWMPEMDGMATLREIKIKHPKIPVIMISGHATIATAMRATEMGAAGFIEKPLDLHATLRAVRKALGIGGINGNSSDQTHRPSKEEASLAIKGGVKMATINPVAFKEVCAKGEKRSQRTLSKSALLYGQGLHTGGKSGLILEPLPPNSGIHFASVASLESVPAHIDYVESTGYATTIKFGDTQAGTIEHIMSALHAYGITNLLVKCNGEVPVMDGSSKDFCSLIEDTGVVEQEEACFDIKVLERIKIGDSREYICIEPSDEFVIDYTLQYPKPVGRQELVFTLSDAQSYRREISAARTFGFVSDIEWLQKQGLALGGRFDNFVLFGEDGPINCELRYPDEPVRHKILDAIGDLYLLGRRIQGRVTAKMTGHSDNIALLSALKRKMRGW